MRPRPVAAVLAALALATLGAAPAADGGLTDAKGHPVAGATLAFESDPGGLFSKVLFTNRLSGGAPQHHTVATATTDANGHFTLAKVVSGGVLVVARRGGRVLGVVVTVLPKGGATRVDLTLAPTKRLNGRVTDAKGAPLAGVPVFVGSTFFDLPPVKTGADGRFTVAVPDLPLPWLAWAHGPHVTSPRVVVHRGGDNHLTGSSGRSVSGVVLEDGHPVAGAEVHVFPPYYGISTHTDAKGRFTLGGFSNTGSPGFALRASHGAAVGGVPFPKPSDTRPLVITLVAPGGLTVHVVDARGRPVGGAQVRVGKHAVSTGADGIATVAGVVQGAAMVQVDAEGHAEAVQQVTVRGAATDVTVRLSPGGDLVVQVRGLDPRDRASARVAVHRLGTWGRGDVPRQVPVDPKGVARVRSLRPGRYLVGLINLMQPKPVPVVVRFPRRRPLTLTVPPARPLAGRVVDGAGHGVAGVQVVARRITRGLPPHHEALLPGDGAVTDATGHFALRRVGPGPYRLIAGRPPHRASRPRTVRGPKRHLVLRLGGGRTLSGVVCDPDGNPLAAAQVTATRVVHGRHAVRAVGDAGRAGVDAKGRFAFPDLAPGRYTVVAHQGRAASQTLLVTAGAKGLTLLVDTGD